MNHYLPLVFSLYAILITSSVVAFRLGSRYRGGASAFYLALIAAFVCAIAWEGVFALSSLFGVGPYVSALQSYGYTTLPQSIDLFCVRTGLTVVLALPAALLTLTLYPRSGTPAVAPQG